MNKCSCINATRVLASLVSRSCEMSEGRNGVLLAAGGPCVPHHYGTGCARHDAIHDPKCALTFGRPDYCAEPWCYVDVEACKRSRRDRVHRSGHPGLDLFYSYTACSSTASDWTSYTQENALEGGSLLAVVPDYEPPLMYKRNPAGDILEYKGSEYYNSSVPFEGTLINYLDNLAGISGGDFTINYTHGSEPGKFASGGSPWGGAVYDVADGLADMAAGHFWITTKRLKTGASFTVPYVNDKIFLVVPKPGGDESYKAQIEKVLDPFSTEVWCLILAIIIFTAVVSVWFSRYGKKFHSDGGNRDKTKFYSRLALDEFLQKGTFFCSSGVSQDMKSSLPEKLLMFGFGFFIMIVVSSYVANLAAFLLRPDFTFEIRTMDDVVKKDAHVCAHNVLKRELKAAWPFVNFVFMDDGDDAGGNVHLRWVNAYKAGECQVIAAGKFDVTHDAAGSEAFHKANLVFTKSIVLENPIAFPTRAELASRLSYWIYKGKESHGITLESTEKEYYQKHKIEPVNLDLSVNEVNDYAQIQPKHLFLPVMFFLGFAILAIIIQLDLQWKLANRSKSSAFGRPSTFDSSAILTAVRNETREFGLGESGGSSWELDRGSLDDDPDVMFLPETAENNVNAPDASQSQVRFGDNCGVQAPKKRVQRLIDEINAAERADESRVGGEAGAASRLYRAFDEILSCMEELKKEE